jgi:arginyl-tRNA synthetase
MKEKVSKYLENLLVREYNISSITINLENPPKKDMWDVAFGCFVLAKELKKSPMDIANELKNIIENDENKIEEIWSLEVAGPYLNIYLNAASYAASFCDMMNTGLYWEVDANKDTVIYVDYIGANVGKPLHIGHMCTPTQWQVIINVFKKLWYKVISDSHIGDWGIIFWKLIVAYKKYWDEKKLAENAVEHLFELYVTISADAEIDGELEIEFRDTFKRLSSWDIEMKNIWARFTKSSIEAMNIQLSRLFVYPDYNIWESFYEWIGLLKMEEYPDLKYSMKDIVEELIEKNIATKNDDGSVWVVFPEEMSIPSCILQKRDGTHGYLASDLASVKYRMDNWNPKKILYFVDVRQQLHLKQAFTISKIAWWLTDEATEITHAHNWFISLKDGAMSTRKGKIIKLEKLLDEAEKRAGDIIIEKRDDISQEKLESLSKIIGTGAIKYGYLKKSRTSDSIFDWDEYMSFDGNSGPYIQYAYVRAQKILKKSWMSPEFKNLVLKTPEEITLVKHILEFKKIIDDMSWDYYPHILCQYVYDMTKKFSSFYNNVQILSEENQQSKLSRLALLDWFSIILEESFDILGISLPLEM